MDAELNSLAENPLLVTSGLPRFDEIRPEHVEPAVAKILADAETTFSQLEENVEPTWDGLLKPLEELDRPFEFGWSPVSHLFGVKNSDELREAYEAVLNDIVAFGLRAKQSEPIYRALKEISDSDSWSSLSECQQRIISQKLLSTELAGIGLEGEQRERFNEIAQETLKAEHRFFQITFSMQRKPTR